MFAYIRGKITFKFENRVVIEANGIGYEVFVQENEANKMSCSNEEILLFTKMIIKEDDVNIYGFMNRDSLDIFIKLMSVNGVGAKAAISILSALPLDELIKAILFEEVEKLTKAPGIGKKTAQRIILELKDKVGIKGISDYVIALNESSEKDEAIIGLMSLGYTKFEASQAIISVIGENLTTEDYIKSALKSLMRR
ncbi:MAG: Holliday junction branch migration protein RuvA [Eubacteriales bacterium]